MNTQKKTQDEKARKRLMEVARSGKSLMPRQTGSSPLMPAGVHSYAGGGPVDDIDARNAKVSAPDFDAMQRKAGTSAAIAAAQAFAANPGAAANIAGTGMSFDDVSKKAGIAAATRALNGEPNAVPDQGPTPPMREEPQGPAGTYQQQFQPVAAPDNSAWLGDLFSGASGTGNTSQRLPSLTLGKLGQDPDPLGYAEGGLVYGQPMSTYNLLRMRGQVLDDAVTRMVGPQPQPPNFLVPQRLMRGNVLPVPQTQSEPMLKGGMPGMERNYAEGGRISGWNVNRVQQIEDAINGVVRPQPQMILIEPPPEVPPPMEQQTTEVPHRSFWQVMTGQQPSYASGGPIMPPGVLWDGRMGGEVPPGPEGVDTVPAITQAGPVMLDSQIGPGRQEYVLTPEMVEALGGAGELDVLRQALGGQAMCAGEGMACGGRRKGVPKMAGGGERKITNPHLLRKAEEARQAFIASHGPTYRTVDIQPFAREEASKLERGAMPVVLADPPPTAEQRQVMPAAQPALPAPVPPAESNGDLIERKMYGSTPIYKNNLMPGAQAEYGRAIFSDTTEGATREGLDKAIRGRGQTVPYSASSPGMVGSKAEADLAIAKKWYSLKPEERGRMPDYVAEALGKPYARPETQDQVWAAAQRQEARNTRAAQDALLAGIEEARVKGEYGVKAAEAKAQDEASKYEVEYKADPFTGEVVPSYKFKGRGPIPEGGLMPSAQSAAPVAKMPTLTPKQQHYWSQYQAENNPAKKAAMRSALVEMFPELADLIGAQGVR